MISGEPFLRFAIASGLEVPQGMQNLFGQLLKLIQYSIQLWKLTSV